RDVVDQLAQQAPGDAQRDALRVGVLHLVGMRERLARRLECLPGMTEDEQGQGQPGQRRYSRIMAVQERRRRVLLRIVEPDDALQLVEGEQRLAHVELAEPERAMA